MFDHMEGRGVPRDYDMWRTPMLAATGSCTAPHQDPNGVGSIIHCYAGYKLFFVPINSTNPLIVRFDDIEFEGAIGLEYLFYPPHQYAHFVLSPGQTL